jgi:hypothetical protein
LEKKAYQQALMDACLLLFLAKLAQRVHATLYGEELELFTLKKSSSAVHAQPQSLCTPKRAHILINNLKSFLNKLLQLNPKNIPSPQPLNKKAASLFTEMRLF